MSPSRSWYRWNTGWGWDWCFTEFGVGSNRYKSWNQSAVTFAGIWIAANEPPRWANHAHHKNPAIFSHFGQSKSVDLHMRSTYQRLVFSSLGDTSGTDTHTHSQNWLPYTSLVHAHWGIINKAAKNVPNSETKTPYIWICYRETLLCLGGRSPRGIR